MTYIVSRGNDTYFFGIVFVLWINSSPQYTTQEAFIDSIFSGGEDSQTFASSSLKAATRLVAPTISPRILIEVEAVRKEASEVDAVLGLSI